MISSDIVFILFSENLVGTGGCSHVYRGCLPDGKELAIKISKSSEDVIKEFVHEIEIITTLHHTHIISLSGFCFEGNNLLLVYDLLPRGSLEENLYGRYFYFASFARDYFKSLFSSIYLSYLCVLAKVTRRTAVHLVGKRGTR